MATSYPVTTDEPVLSEALLYETNHLYTRESADLITGQNLKQGTAVSIITASGKLTQFNQDGADGSQTPVGILVYDVDATNLDKPAAYIARGPCTLKRQGVIWPLDITVGEQATAEAVLEGLGFIFRDVIPTA